MKRLFAVTLVALALFGCKSMPFADRDKNPYEKPPFYAKYLSPSNPFDVQIQRTLDALRANPNSAPLHNDLGTMLLQKGFPKDAEVEFSRAVRADHKYYPGYYNRALVRMAHEDYSGAKSDLEETVSLKPGNASALFQLGLMEEKRQNNQRAIEYYAKAFSINRALIDPHVNPRIVDSQLIDLALIRLYPMEHNRQSMRFQGTPNGYVAPATQTIEAISPQPPAAAIVTPAPPVTEPGVQQPAPAPKKP